MDEDRLQLQRLAGVNITKFAPLFSPDANLIFVVIENTIQVYSTSTGRCVRTLDGARGPIISLEYDLKNTRILVSCTELGEVIRWNWSTGTILSQVSLILPPESLCETFNIINQYVDGDSPCAFITYTRKRYPVQCFIVDTVKGNTLNTPLTLKLGRQMALVAVDNGVFKYIAVAQGSHVFFIDYTSWKWRKLTNPYSKNRITCIAVHPKEKMAVTGDDTGKIQLWRQFFGEQDNKTTMLHWHHTAVTSVAFSFSGSALYSSGLEAVLVKWNIARPEEKVFLPRASAIILHIATSQENAFVAISTADNGIQIVDVNMKVKCTIQEFTFIFDDKTGMNNFPVGLKVNPRKNTLVLNGRAGHLQFYSTYTRSMLYNMDIVGQNQLSMESGKILYNTHITHAAFNIDWMATVETFNDNQHMPELRLKFWMYNKTDQRYALNTNVELPHEGGIKAIEFSNPYYVDNLRCATVGVDKIIKIWSLEDTNSIHREGKAWYCIAKTTYKNLSVESIKFSEDGSLLAAGYGNSLCIYMVNNLKMLAALVPNPSFDGMPHKTQVIVPRIKPNGSQKDLNAHKQKTMHLFTNLLSTEDETLLKEIKNSIKAKRVWPSSGLDETEKKQLYRKIKLSNQLNLFQKLLIYRKLGMNFQLSQEWHSKISDYIRVNVPDDNKTQALTKEVPLLTRKTRFKAKYKLNRYMNRKLKYDDTVTSKLTPLMSILKLDNAPNAPITNGLSNGQVEAAADADISPPPQYVPTIRKVAFFYGDYAHLVISCTENRLFVWNLLSLRLQSALKLSTEHVVVDPLTNLVAVFTKNRELYLFQPSTAMPLYCRLNMPGVQGMAWLPRKRPNPQSILVNWQARSTLYFLTENHEILYLAADDGRREPTLMLGDDADDVAQLYSTLGAVPENQFSSIKKEQGPEEDTAIGVHGRTAVKALLTMSTHTMAPLSLLCGDFLKATIQVNAPQEEKPLKSEPENEAKSGNETSDGEDEDVKMREIRNLKTSIDKSCDSDEESIQDELRKVLVEKSIDFVW